VGRVDITVICGGLVGVSVDEMVGIIAVVGGAVGMVW
jgi:hypothetical protein